MEKILCIECGAANDYELREDVRKYEGDGYSFTLNVKTPFCKKCGAPITVEEIEEKIDKQANEKIRACRGIITKEEILGILSKYSVSQKLLSKMLGWGEITLTRYISGGYTPNTANSNRLKSLNNPYIFQKILNDYVEENKIESDALIDKLQTNINKNIQDMELSSGKIYAVINWFLNQSTEEEPITQLALQKMLYFSQAWNKIWNNEWMFQDDCEAWVHGAVYRNVYNEFKTFKYNALPKLNMETALDKREIEVLEFVKAYYFDTYTAKYLEKICHAELPFKMARNGYEADENCHNMIEKQSIDEYYQKVANEYDISRENPNHIKKYLSDLLS